MKQVAIIAPTGMLGSEIYNVLKNFYKLTLVYRSKEGLAALETSYGDTKNHKKIKFDLHSCYENYITSKKISTKNPLFSLDVDLVINCAGIIKPYANKNPESTFFINSAIPHLLSSIYKEKLLHITTDCVFSGKTGAPYNENSPYSATDLYGLTKSLGEPKEKSLILRTSIIGPEIFHSASLVEWFKKQKRAYGFTNHLWNGVTTRQFGYICRELLLQPNKYPKTGLYHIFSNDISKYNLLLELKKRYNSDCLISPIKAREIDRRLSTIYPLNNLLKIPLIEQQIKEM